MAELDLNETLAGLNKEADEQAAKDVELDKAKPPKSKSTVWGAAPNPAKGLHPLETQIWIFGCTQIQKCTKKRPFSKKRAL